MGITERKEREKEQRKKDIIDAAERVFFNKGFDTATVDDVANEAELSKGTVYLYFKSKEDIHFAISMRGMDILNRLIREIYDEKKNSADNILEFGKAYVRFTRDYKNYFKSIMIFDSSKIDKVDISRKMKILEPDSPLNFFIEVLDKGKKDGSIRTDIPSKELAFILWSQITGVLQFIVLRSHTIEMLEFNPEDLILNQFKILLKGIVN